jgi:hypothetical protein
MIDKYLKEKSQRIADEATGRRISVIVQMHTSEEIGEFVRATTEVIDRRRAVTSARDLLPPAKDRLELDAGGKMTERARRSLKRNDPLSASLFLATEVLSPLAEEGLRDRGKSALKPLLDSDWVKGTTQPKPVHFEMSGSAVLELSKDELIELPKQIPNIADIFANRCWSAL